jgi:uncharacterized protein (TIGR03437 family)
VTCAGKLIVVGQTSSTEFPTTSGSFQRSLGGRDDVFVLQANGVGPKICLAGLSNGASFIGGAVAPGEITTLFGSQLGPDVLMGLQLDTSGIVARELGGTRVFFDGEPAPLVYVHSGQISAVVPYSVAGRPFVSVVVERIGMRSAAVVVPVSRSAPGLFAADSSGKGQAAALDENGQPNGRFNPAARGSVVVLYATGEGETEPSGQDGKPAAEPLPRPKLPVTATIGGQAAEVLYAGGAPGLLAGLLQINVRVPEQIDAALEVPVAVRIGDAETQSGVTLSIK